MDLTEMVIFYSFFFIFPKSELSLEMEEEEERVYNELSQASVGMAGTSDAAPNTSGTTPTTSGAESNTSGAEPNTSSATPTKAGHAHVHCTLPVVSGLNVSAIRYVRPLSPISTKYSLNITPTFCRYVELSEYRVLFEGGSFSRKYFRLIEFQPRGYKNYST